MRLLDPGVRNHEAPKALHLPPARDLAAHLDKQRT